MYTQSPPVATPRLISVSLFGICRVVCDRVSLFCDFLLVMDTPPPGEGALGLGLRAPTRASARARERCGNVVDPYSIPYDT